MRGQTQTNRVLGINAGRQRREAAGNREAISAARRGEVFRQDVEHADSAFSPYRTGAQDDRIEKLDAAEPLILQMHAAGATYLQMREATGLSHANVFAVLLRNGLIRRRQARPRLK